VTPIVEFTVQDGKKVQVHEPEIVLTDVSKKGARARVAYAHPDGAPAIVLAVDGVR
jgi:hypothetical protein